MTKKFFSEVFALRGTPWYRWHPNIALRYLPAVERVRKGQSFRVLEVGSGGLGIAPYLKMPVAGVDREFEPPFYPLLTRVKGEATKLKFGDNSFDVVVSMDMLEHLPKEKRQRAVLEMLRVAKSLVVIGVPCGKLSMEHDISIAGARSLDSPRPRVGVARDDEGADRGIRFLEEQVKYGLPEEADILYYIKAAEKRLKKQVNIEVKGNMNINLRKFLMRGWMSKNILVNILFRKVFLILIPLFRLIDREPYYRKLFFIEIKENG